MAKVAEYKKKVVKEIVDLINKYPITATINMENLPAPQLQKMRAELRDRVEMTMTKRRLIKKAFEEAEKTKKGIIELSKNLEGMPALMFTKENPFKLFKILQKNKSPAPAKPNQIAPKDIMIPAGPTPFAPGPVIGELAMIGIKSGVDGGKVAIKVDAIVAKKGEKIKPKVAEILTRLDIQPMEVGLDLVAAYEDGTIYTKDILSIDEDQFMSNLGSAASGALNVAMFIGYPTKDTIELLISKASQDAKALGLSQNIIDDGVTEALLGKAEMNMLGLKTVANIEVSSKPKVEAKEKPKPEVKEEKKVEEKPKEEVKKETPLEKKEEKVLEAEKEIIKEETKLETQKPADTGVEQEVQEAVKEVEEKKLENERMDKEKELEKIEKQKEEEKKKVEQEKKVGEKPKEEVKEVPKPETNLEKKEVKVLEEEKEIIEEEKKLETQKPADTGVEQEVQEAVKEVEEKKLENERMDKEKEIEKIEKQKPKPADTDNKVADMVAKFKKAGKEPTADQLINGNKPNQKKVVKKEVEVPKVEELVKKREEKKKEVEDAEKLLDQLKKKGTLRK